VTVTVKIVDEPIIHIVRDAEFEFVQHREMTNCIEGFTEIEGNDNDVAYGLLASMEVIVWRK